MVFSTMLKRVFINGKKVPVPVPVRDLGEAMTWLEQTLVPPGHVITRIVLDEKVVTDSLGQSSVCGQLLDEQTKLEVQIDSPVNLSVQMIEVAHSLAVAVMVGLKSLAVECWQARPTWRPTELDSVRSDLDLMLDQITHVAGLTDPEHVDVAAIQGIGVMLRRATLGLGLARGNSDWRGAARILLNRVEPLLKDFVQEAETLQVRLLTLHDPLAKQELLPVHRTARAPTG